MKKVCYCSKEKNRKPIVISIGGGKDGTGATKEIEIVVCPHGKNEPCDCGKEGIGDSPSDYKPSAPPAEPSPDYSPSAPPAETSSQPSAPPAEMESGTGKPSTSKPSPGDSSESPSSQTRSTSDVSSGSLSNLDPEGEPAKAKRPSEIDASSVEPPDSSEGSSESKYSDAKDDAADEPADQKTPTSNPQEKEASQPSPRDPKRQQSETGGITQYPASNKPKNEDPDQEGDTDKLPLVPPRYHGEGCVLEVSVLEKHHDTCGYKKKPNDKRHPLDDRSGSYDVVGRMVFKTCSPDEDDTRSYYSASSGEAESQADVAQVLPMLHQMPEAFTEYDSLLRMKRANNKARRAHGDQRKAEVENVKQIEDIKKTLKRAESFKYLAASSKTFPNTATVSVQTPILVSKEVSTDESESILDLQSSISDRNVSNSVQTMSETEMKYSQDKLTERNSNKSSAPQFYDSHYKKHKSKLAQVSVKKVSEINVSDQPNKRLRSKLEQASDNKMSEIQTEEKSIDKFDKISNSGSSEIKMRSLQKLRTKENSKNNDETQKNAFHKLLARVRGKSQYKLGESQNTQTDNKGKIKIYDARTLPRHI